MLTFASYCSIANEIQEYDLMLVDMNCHSLPEVQS
jgi:hypothetical protein